MKRFFITSFLTILTVGLLGSCMKNIEERLDKDEATLAELNAAIGQYEGLSGDITSVIEALRAEVGTRPASEQQSVWNCIAALQNQKGTFDTAIAALSALVGEKSVSVQIDEATSKLIAEYQLDGLASSIQAIKDKLSEKTGISALSDQVSALQGKVDVIAWALSKISDYEAMIQSVRINPVSADGSVRAEDGILTFTFTVTPATALDGVKNLAKCLKLYANEVEVKTKAGVFPEIPVTKAEIIDASKGEVSVEADVTDYLPAENTSALSVALNVRTGVSNFTTEFVPVTVPIVEYVEIDGLKWATMNLGAEKETDYGDYFAWGATELAYSSLSSNTFTFVASRPTSYGGSGWTQSKGFDYENTPYYNGSAYTKYTSSDSKTVLESGDDAATALLGSGWRMPTSQEFQNLANACGGSSSYDKTTYASTACGKATTFTKGIYWCGNYDGVAGALFCDGTNKLFFPAAGRGNDASLDYAGSRGSYGSSSLDTDHTDNAYGLGFVDSGDVYPQDYYGRYRGVSVRPVSDAE